jgi:hypothetical protein
VQHEKAVRSEDHDERRRDQRVDVGLGEIEPRLPLRVFQLLPSKEGKRARAADFEVFAPLQEHALGPGEFFPHARQIFALVLKIEIASQAVAEHVVGRLVPFEAAAVGFRKVDRHGECQQQNAGEP